MSTPSVVAIVSQHSKDVNQLCNALMDLGIRPITFNKGDTQKHPDKLPIGSCFNRENVGRESETYFTYILERIKESKVDPHPQAPAPAQEDYTIFLQEDATRHCPSIIQTIGMVLNEIKTNPDKIAIPAFFGDVHQGIDMVSQSTSRRFNGYPGNNDIKPLFERYFGHPFPVENHWFTDGCQFMVHKSFYLGRNVEKIELYLNELRTHKDPFVALAWERFWPWYILKEKE